MNNISDKKKIKGGNLVTCLVWLLIATFLLCLNYLITGTCFFKCIFHSLTGYDCPACGLQRMLIALFNGDFQQAFWYNPYLVIMLPYFVVLAFLSFAPKERMVAIRQKLCSPILVGVMVVLMVAWWIFRNTIIWQEIIEKQITSM